jgi:pimeloyl-ACP methyl ester carboxylesterase
LLLFLNPLFKWIETVLVNFIGDIVIYTASDARSRFYDARLRILDGAVEALRGLLEEGRYGRVIVAGHSLGSVIAFDALNRLNQMMNLGVVDARLAKKIQDFVTFGSPLDKIAFFFRERTRDDEYIRRQILQHFHSFKARPLSEQPNPKEISDPFRALLEHVRWINFWDPADPISGCLDFYRVDQNVMFSMGKSSFAAHSAYWEWMEMHEQIIREAGWG